MAAVGVAVAITLASCGSGDDSSGSSPATSPTPAATASTGPSAPSAAGTSIDVTIAGGKVTPDPSRRVEVKTGDQVHLTVTSDTADEIHVHGYDIEKEAEAGKPVNFRFKADMDGVFEVEVHKPTDSQIAELEVKP
jgi:pullulanase/glycogen debranching enzyme